jgi:hypothetical protein
MQPPDDSPWIDQVFQNIQRYDDVESASRQFHGLNVAGQHNIEGTFRTLRHLWHHLDSDRVSHGIVGTKPLHGGTVSTADFQHSTYSVWQ